MPLLAHLRASLGRHALLRGGERVLVAVSGGPDSLALLHLLWRLREELGLRLHVAHLDHGFRGAQSAAEAAFVARYAQQLGLPATIERRDVPALARERRQNAQAAARGERYAFLAQVALREAADALAVAHQAEDQAETLLLHLLRGAGPAGLRAMRRSVAWGEWALEAAAAAGPPLIRPLLDIERVQIEAYCVAHALDPQRDPSNDMLRYARTRVRHNLLPLLSEYNSAVVAALGQTAAICGDDYDYMQRELDRHWPVLVSIPSDDVLAFDGNYWQALHPALQRYALRRAAAQLAGAAEIGFAQLEAARSATASRPGVRATLSGDLRLLVGYSGFALCRGEALPPSALPQLQQAELALAVPGVTDMGGGWQVEIAAVSPPAWAEQAITEPDSVAWQTVLDADALNGELLLRGRRAGERFMPAGGIGSRRLQDFFVDRKLPRQLRQRWPLLATRTSIVWVVGLRADARFQAGESSERRLWVRCWNEAEK